MTKRTISVTVATIPEKKWELILRELDLHTDDTHVVDLLNIAPPGIKGLFNNLTLFVHGLMLNGEQQFF